LCVARGQLLDLLVGESSVHVNGASSTSHLAPIPIEPLEPSELSAPPSVQGRLYGDHDGSLGIRDDTAARAKALGIDTPLFKGFPCILAGHDHIARLNFTRFKNTERGFWQYRCPDLDRARGLAEVRAFVAYGHERHLSNVEAARWRELLDFEANLRLPVPLDLELPEPCPEAARIVAGAMRLLVGLRDRRFPRTEPFPFAYEFAQAYCDLSGDRVRSGKDWLERAEVIYRVGATHRSILWKLAAQDAVGASAKDEDRP
jgi:hypothetical protein